MKTALQKLIKKMPPPEEVERANVNWPRLEEHVKIQYPDSFKEYASVYGACCWCGHAQPVWAMGDDDAELRLLRRQIGKWLKPLKGNMYIEEDDEREDVQIPLYPKKGGLYPFMVDHGEGRYCWRTEEPDPNAWPIVCWRGGRILTLEGMTIADLLLEWLEGKPRIVEFLGEPEPLRLD